MQAEYDQMNDDIAAIHAEIEQVRMDADAAREKKRLRKRLPNRRLQAKWRLLPVFLGVFGWFHLEHSFYKRLWMGQSCSWKVHHQRLGWRASIGDYHQGVDLSCKYEPVYCMADGTVTTSGWFGTGGQAVTVNHGNGIVSWYLHGSQLLVSVGQKVSAGQQIMVSGNTGFSTGAHLHFQINVNSPNGVTGTAVNPTAYFGW
ncbi:MAG: peptidoglycan DD-metalloendopeptidase family protein [Slackia sp.]